MIARIMLTAVLSALLMLGAACTRQVSFSRTVYPILQSHCGSCHLPGGEGYAASGFSVETYDTLMKGTRFGAVIEPGSSISSTLVILISGGAHRSINMPRKGEVLSDKQIGLVRTWIDQGARNN
jgi:mono/diheme cytochrome c family protein